MGMGRSSLKLELHFQHTHTHSERMENGNETKKSGKLKNKRQLGNFVFGQHSKPKINKYKKFSST